MKAWRSGILVVLVLISAGVLVSSPAFATPNLTASSGNRPVAPFITPLGNTRDSSSRGVVVSPETARLTLGGTNISCRTANAIGYVTVTNTQLRLTSMKFGDGRGGTCTISTGGTIDNDMIIGGASSINPWHLHVRSNDAANRSAAGTINISTSFSFSATNGGVSCDFTVSARQSVAVTYTYGTTSLVVDGTLTVGVRGVTNPLRLCPASGAGSFRATYTVRPDTTRDRITVTNP